MDGLRLMQRILLSALLQIRLPGSCWNTSPNYNRWFKFQATGPMAKITVRRGGVYGTIARINAAIWQANGTTQVVCKTYVNDFDNVIIQSMSLVPVTGITSRLIITMQVTGVHLAS